MKPKVEFFTETVDDVEYVNVGLVWYHEERHELVRAVLGAFHGELTSDQMKVIGGLAEQACMYVLGLDGEPHNVHAEPIEVESTETVGA